MKTEYCYSTDEEVFSYTEFGDVVDYFKNNTDDPVGCSYWRGEQQPLTLAECIDVDRFLEQCDESACEEMGDIYDDCFQDVTVAEKQELRELILAWANKSVNMRFWKVVNSVELKITQEDLERRG